MRWQRGARKRAKELSDIYTDDQAVMIPSIFMPWDASGVYTTGDRARYGELLYRCLQGHTAQASWTPIAAPSLWVRIDDPAIEWPDWKQPTGGHDSYSLGAKVAHKSKHWISTTDANVWEPGVYGWKEAT